MNHGADSFKAACGWGFMLLLGLCFQGDHHELHHRLSAGPGRCCPKAGRRSARGVRRTFNGTDFTGWKVPEGDNATGRSLMASLTTMPRARPKASSICGPPSGQELRPRLDWRFKTDQKGYPNKVPSPARRHQQEGRRRQGNQGRHRGRRFRIYRGQEDAQINIWMYLAAAARCGATAPEHPGNQGFHDTQEAHGQAAR